MQLQHSQRHFRPNLHPFSLTVQPRHIAIIISKAFFCLKEASSWAWRADWTPEQRLDSECLARLDPRRKMCDVLVLITNDHMEAPSLYNLDLEHEKAVILMFFTQSSDS
jgi:hypothetical protein